MTRGDKIRRSPGFDARVVFTTTDCSDSIRGAHAGRDRHQEGTGRGNSPSWTATRPAALPFLHLSRLPRGSASRTTPLTSAAGHEQAPSACPHHPQNLLYKTTRCRWLGVQNLFAPQLLAGQPMSYSNVTTRSGTFGIMAEAAKAEAGTQGKDVESVRAGTRRKGKDNRGTTEPRALKNNWSCSRSGLRRSND